MEMAEEAGLSIFNMSTGVLFVSKLGRNDGFMCSTISWSQPALVHIHFVPANVPGPCSITPVRLCVGHSADQQLTAQPRCALCSISLDSPLSSIYAAAYTAATTAIKQQQGSNVLNRHHGGGCAVTRDHRSVARPFQNQAQYGPVLVICKIELLALVLARRQPLQMRKACHLGRVFGTVHLLLH